MISINCVQEKSSEPLSELLKLVGMLICLSMSRLLCKIFSSFDWLKTRSSKCYFSFIYHAHVGFFDAPAFSLLKERYQHNIKMTEHINSGQMNITRDFGDYEAYVPMNEASNYGYVPTNDTSSRTRHQST